MNVPAMMTYPKRALPSLSLALLIAGNCSAGVVTFFFHNGANPTGSGLELQDQANGTSTVDGVTLSMRAESDSGAGEVLRGTTNGFGVRQLGVNTSDLQYRIDNRDGFEAIVFSFDQAGTFNSIDLRGIENNGPEAALVFDGGPTIALNETTPDKTATDEFTNIATSFTAGQEITLRMASGAPLNEDFGLEDFVITVPEPGTYALIAGAAAALLLACRKRA